MFCLKERRFEKNSNKVILSDITTTNKGEDDTDNLCHKVVIVRYDGQAYLGQVTDVDNKQGDLQVTCMHKVGHNRFFWPSLPNTCWYDYEDMIANITEPVKVTGRHHRYSMSAALRHVNTVTPCQLRYQAFISFLSVQLRHYVTNNVAQI